MFYCVFFFLNIVKALGCLCLTRKIMMSYDEDKSLAFCKFEIMSVEIQQYLS